MVRASGPATSRPAPGPWPRLRQIRSSSDAPFRRRGGRAPRPADAVNRPPPHPYDIGWGPPVANGRCSAAEFDGTVPRAMAGRETGASAERSLPDILPTRRLGLVLTGREPWGMPEQPSPLQARRRPQRTRNDPCTSVQSHAKPKLQRSTDKGKLWTWCDACWQISHIHGAKWMARTDHEG